jgi:hypothetical protein
MNNFNVDNYPSLKNMHPMKVKIMTDLIDATEGKPIAQALPALLAAKQQLGSLGLSFSAEETSLLMDAVSNHLSPENKGKVEAMKMIMERNGMG